MTHAALFALIDTEYNIVGVHCGSLLIIIISITKHFY